MTTSQYLTNLQVPTGMVDVILDTDAYNEIDDQFAIAYLLRCEDKLNVKGLCAAPFFNSKSDSPADGMIKSYEEIKHILTLAGRADLIAHTYKGSENYLANEETPKPSDAASYMVELSKNYTAEKPLYIIAIGAITNVASALLMDPTMKERVVVVWLGGHAHHYCHNKEFNCFQDVAADRVVFGSGVPVVQLPCRGVVDRFHTTQWELEHWLLGKNDLCDYLVKNTVAFMNERAGENKPWSKPIWDATAIGWFMNDGQKFMMEELRHSPVFQYDHRYSFDYTRHLIKYITWINRDALFADMFQRLSR